MNDAIPPGIARRAGAVWRRNFLAWRKSAMTALLGSFVEPLLYLLVLGYGLGRLVGVIDGMPYVRFLTAGILATSAMNSATFEGLYLAYTRMAVLRVWDGMLAAPLSVRDVVVGEVLWMGSKSLFSCSAILLVMWLLGQVAGWTALWVLPLALLSGVVFGGLALVVTSYARSYDFFVYYVTLLVTPMVLLSGVFFPTETLPFAVDAGMALLPLRHVVGLIRPVVLGQPPGWETLAHLAVLGLYAFAAMEFAVRRLERRMLH